jgi:pimeloyl-ACP methyl ester carboxylesterase
MITTPTTRDASAQRRGHLLVLSALCLLLAGCTAPMGADRSSPGAVYRELNRSAITSWDYSPETLQVLHRHELVSSFGKDPAGTLSLLHRKALEDGRRDTLFALSELSYLHARKLDRSVRPGWPEDARDYYLTSALYAYDYLLGDEGKAMADPFDDRFRKASDFYNLSVARAFMGKEGTNRIVHLVSNTRKLPQGTVNIQFSQPGFKWSMEDIAYFLPADEFRVRGLTVRNRQSGLGSPLIAVGRVTDAAKFPRRIAATVFLRMQGRLKDWNTGGLAASLELYSTYDTAEVQVGNRTIPLEGDTTAPTAYGLNDSRIWSLGSRQFFSSVQLVKTGLYLTEPYESGKIPVIFVHGTFSSPVWWTEMWNTLRGDAELRHRFQFWYFVYNSGNPISVSANKLREAIQAKIATLDPGGTNAALQQTVVIGHSQGGLLTRLTATDTGDRLWRTVSDKDLETMQTDPETREVIRRFFFFKPMPSVKRVVFISTPHRGSYLASSFTRKLARWFMKLPAEVITTPARLAKARKEIGLPSDYKQMVPSSLDGMSPKNPWLLALAECPLGPEVKAHSIVAIKGNDEPSEGSDGVVKYTSAHFEAAESELIVRSAHSCQGTPPAIEEVRRILLEHLRSLPGSRQ